MYLHGKHCNGIRWNGKHSQTDFWATLTSRDIGMPEKKRYLESVPYSNVTYDFSALYGAQTYNRRALKYEFTISSKRGWKYLRSCVQAFVNWLYEPQGTAELRDSTDPEYHFNAELVSAVPSFLFPNIVMVQFEQPADVLASAKAKWAELNSIFYSRLAGVTSTELKTVSQLVAEVLDGKCGVTDPNNKWCLVKSSIRAT